MLKIFNIVRWFIARALRLSAATAWVAQHRKETARAATAVPRLLAKWRYHQWFGMPLIMQPPSVCMLEISQPVVTET